MAELFKDFGLDTMTIDFIGHAVALHCDDSYLTQPALHTIEKIKLYNDSLQRFAGSRSPYIYPLYGLGELPQVSSYGCYMRFRTSDELHSSLFCRARQSSAES